MHSLNRDGDGTYCVGRVEVRGDHCLFVPMFDRLEVSDAIRLVSTLNGGQDHLLSEAADFLEEHAIK